MNRKLFLLMCFLMLTQAKVLGCEFESSKIFHKTHIGLNKPGTSNIEQLYQKLDFYYSFQTNLMLLHHSTANHYLLPSYEGDYTIPNILQNYYKPKKIHLNSLFKEDYQNLIDNLNKIESNANLIFNEFQELSDYQEKRYNQSAENNYDEILKNNFEVFMKANDYLSNAIEELLNQLVNKTSGKKRKRDFVAKINARKILANSRQLSIQLQHSSLIWVYMPKLKEVIFEQVNSFENEFDQILLLSDRTHGLNLEKLSSLFYKLDDQLVSFLEIKASLVNETDYEDPIVKFMAGETIERTMFSNTREVIRLTEELSYNLENPERFDYLQNQVINILSEFMDEWDSELEENPELRKRLIEIFEKDIIDLLNKAYEMPRPQD